jgi:allantoate deiminase
MAWELSTPLSNQLAETVMDYCEKLASYSQDKGAMDRRYLTKEHRLTNQQIALWAEGDGLTSWQDPAGNQWVRLEASKKTNKRIIIGSHTDTVPNGGKYDGILGVVAPIVLLKHYAEIGHRFDVHIDVVGFGDEEGTRFGATLLGSSAIAGKWKSKWRELLDEDGISLAKAMRDFGLDVSKISEAQIDSIPVVGYVELHIEQGPVLEEQNLAISAVAGIAGARRFTIKMEGKAGHAGTVPMLSRQDPLVVASHWISELDNMAKQTSRDDHPVLATVGKLEVLPGGVNVIPGCVQFSLDVRSGDDEIRDAFLADLTTRLEELTLQHNVVLNVMETHTAKAVQCSQELTKTLTEIVENIVGKPLLLTSGAGHDAMVMAEIVPTTMLFMRCKEGISHNPLESVAVEDVSVAIEAMSAFIHEVAVDKV